MTVLRLSSLRSIALAVLATFGSAPVLAQQPDPWTGFNVSVGVGRAKTEFSSSADASADWERPNSPAQFLKLSNSVSTFLSSAEQSTFGTMQIGYEAPVGGFVIGAFAGLDFSPEGLEASSSASYLAFLDVRQCRLDLQVCSISVQGPFASPDIHSTIDIGKSWSVGGRLGVPLGNSLLLYGLAGYTEAKVTRSANFTYLDTAGTIDDLTLTSSDWMPGYFVGAGGEWLVAQNLALRIEYRFADYGRVSQTTSEPTNFLGIPFGSASLTTTQDVEVQSIRGELVWKLGSP